jgi:AraC-like DNA-binding protein
MSEPIFLRPSERLAPYVSYYFIVENEAQSGEPPFEVNVLPVPHAQMVFSYGDESYERDMGGPLKHSPGFAITGYTTRTVAYSNPGRLGVIMAGFHPWGLAPFLDFELRQATDRNVDLHRVMSGTGALERTVRAATSAEQRIGSIEAFLLSHLRKPALDESIVAACKKATERQGLTTVAALADDADLSVRQFQRRFIDRIGVEPKLFLQLVRFQRAFELMDQSGASPDWIAIADTAGYYDQSHFINDFKGFTGLTPTDYLLRMQRSEVGRAFDENIDKDDPLRRMYI